MIMNRLLTVITVVITTILLAIVINTIDDQRTISVLQVKVDSLTHQCYVKDTAIDEATRTAIQLSDRLNKLYEKNPVIHKELFNEAD